MEQSITGFEQLFTQFMRIFQGAYLIAQELWIWLSTPLIETLGEEFAGFIGEDIAQYAPLEFMFGAGIIIVLIYAIVKFFMPI